LKLLILKSCININNIVIVNAQNIHFLSWLIKNISIKINFLKVMGNKCSKKIIVSR